MKKLPKRSLLCAACLCTTAPALWAQSPAPTGDTLQFRASAGVEHDSNVRRTANAESDQVGILAAGVTFDKQYSLQRIRVDAEAATYRHRDLSNLNYSTLNYKAAWDFQFTPRLRGVLSAERRQYRDIVDTLNGTGVDLRTDRNEVLEAIYELTGGWRVLAGLTHERSHSEEPRAYEASPSVTSARVGVGYEFASGASVYGRLRRGDGEYDNVLVGRDFKETQPELAVRWPLTAKTSVEGRLGHIKRKHEGAPERDFSGVVGDASVTWEATAKTRLTAGFAHELGSYEFAGGGNVRGNRFYVAPVWKPTEQTAVRLRYQREERDWRVLNVASPDVGRSDVTQWSSAAFEWEPRRNILVSAALRGERRKSSLSAFNYRATIVALGAKVTF